jgi:tetratricopeptide (TPR) repeat protein
LLKLKIMNLFKKLFGKVETPTTENKEIIENNKPVENKEIKEELSVSPKKDVDLSIEIGSGDSIYQFNGVNNDFIDKLYFVNEEQKAKFLKFIDAIIVKFKFKDITSQTQFFKFQDNLEKYHDFVDNYKESYPDYTAGLTFPYFDYSELISWNITDVTERRVNGEVSTINKNAREVKAEALNLNACEFNIRNKAINNIKDITVEEKVLMDFFASENYFKHYRISSPIHCLIEYYFKIDDFKKVDDLMNVLINKVEPEDKHNIEKDFDYLSNISVIAGNKEKGIEYANRGIEFIKTNFPKPKTKTMGNVYKSLAQILFDNKDYEKALLIINDALAYNENLSLKQLQAKIEKQLSK